MKISNQEKEWLLREKYGGKEAPGFFVDLKRRESGEPLAYVIGNIPFLDCMIDLSYRPLIPRVETEYWVNQVVQHINITHTIRILDVFAGSGCIGVALLKKFPNARVDFLEKDLNLKKQIARNLKGNNIPSRRTKIIIGDALRDIPEKQYDYIFANPPYIPHTKKNSLPYSVKRFEPHLALFAKENGLRYVKHLIGKASEILAPGGKMWIEFGYGQKEDMEATLKKKKNLQYTFLKDQHNKWRVLEISCKMGEQTHASRITPHSHRYFRWHANAARGF